MTDFISIDNAGKIKCPLMRGEPCLGTNCVFWKFREYKRHCTEDNVKDKIVTDPGYGVCGWLGVLNYFLERTTVR